MIPVLVSALAALPASALDIVLSGPLAGDAAAAAAFNRAAAQYESRITDNITINISASFSGTGLGLASFSLQQTSYAALRTALINDAAADASPNDAIVASLPANISFQSDSSVLNNPTIAFTFANAKALGLRPANDPALDGTITFSATPGTFDFDNSDGVGSGLVDFETVAAHEIGHVLGFTDRFNATTPTTLDLFRFAAGNTPANATQFGTNTREIRDVDTFFSTAGTAGSDLRFSSSVTDGFDAGHWFNLGANPIGVMDPQILGTQVNLVNANDLLAFDVIGYNVAPIPEPTVLSALGVASLAGLMFRRRRQG